MKPRYFVVAGLAFLILFMYINFLQNTDYKSISTPSSLHDAGFLIKCDEHFLQPPTNCRITDKESGETISNETILEDLVPDVFECTYETVENHIIPCYIDSGKTQPLRLD